MTEPRRSTRARAREEAAPPPTPEPAETPSKSTAKSLKRKRPAPTARDASTPAAVAESAKKTPEHTLPIRLVDGQPLPTLPAPQPLDLPASEWQDVGQSGVLAASFQRSRAVWISGSNFRLFHANFTPPKKVADRTDQDKQQIQRQKDINRNFPQLGANIEARLVIEPHTFPIRLYGPREFARPPPKKAAPPPQYGQWPNHNAQYPPYHQQPPPYVATQVPYKPPPPPPRPAQPKPPPQQQQQQHTPQSNQKSPPVANTPAPDPVIHMLAQRAGTDPELKSVMKIVAAGQATPAQLQFFQGHINQLTQLLAKQKAQAPAVAPPPSQPPPPGPPPTAPPPTAPPAQAQQSPHLAPPLQPGPPPAGYPPYQPPPVSRPPQQGPPLPAAYPPPQPPQTPQNRPPPPQTPHSRPPPAQIPQSYPPPPLHPQPPYQTPMPPAVHPSYPPFPQQPQPRPPHPNQYTYAQPQHQMNQYNQPPPRTGYRPLIFDFVEGNSDKFYFPSYSFMEWLEGNQGVKISFLITKMKDNPVIKEEKETEKVMAPPATPAPKANGNGNGNALPIATPAQAANAAPNTGNPAGISTPNPQLVPRTPAPSAPPNTNPNAPPTAATPNPTPNTNTPHPPNTPGPAPALATPATPNFSPAPRIEDFDEAKHIDDIAFYRPVTALIYTTNYEILQSLPRAVRPPDDVGRYMEEVIDKCQRDEEGALAFRLPREKGVGEGGAMGLEGAVDAGGGGDEGLGAKRRSIAGGGGGGLGGAGGKRGSVVAA